MKFVTRARTAVSLAQAAAQIVQPTKLRPHQEAPPQRTVSARPAPTILEASAPVRSVIHYIVLGARVQRNTVLINACRYDRVSVPPIRSCLLMFKACPQGTFKNALGPDACQACAGNTSTVSVGSTTSAACKCLDGFYGRGDIFCYGTKKT